MRRHAIYVTTFIFTFMFGMGYPLVSQFLESMGAAPFVVGVVVGTYGVLQILVRLPIGNLSDVHGRRWTLRGSFVAATLAGVFYVTAPSPLWVVPAQVLWGFAAGAFWVSANAYVKDMADEVGGRLAVQKGMNHYAAAIALGLLFGPPLGIAADILGYRAGLSVFIWAGLAGLLSTLWLEPLGQGDQERLGVVEVFARAAELLRIPDLKISLVLTFLYSMLLGLASAFYPFYLRTIGFSAFLIGVLYALRQAANSGSNLLLARARSDDVDPLGPLLVGIGVAALTLSLVPLFETFLPLLALALAAGVGFALMIPSNLSLIAHASPDRETGLAMGIYGTGLGLGQLVSPVMFGYVADLAGLTWAFFSAGLVVCVLGVAAGVWALTVDRTGAGEALEEG